MTDYKQTLNLPKTAFPMKAALPKREPERLAAWEEGRLYEIPGAVPPPGGPPRPRCRIMPVAPLLVQAWYCSRILVAGPTNVVCSM